MKTESELDSDGSGVRCFVAVLLKPAVLDELQVVQRLLRQRLASGVRWTRPEQMHLTLHFLGDVDGDRVADLEQVLKQTGEGQIPFELALEGVGHFPPEGRPRVIWAGLAGDLDRLQELQSGLVQAMSELGSHREKGVFHPHLTLGRVKGDPGGMDLKTALAGIEGPRAVHWTVREVSLMQSDLLPSGARYTVVSTAEFGGEG